MVKHPWIPSVIAIIGIVIIVVVAMSNYIDGLIVTGAITVVGTIGGYKAGQYLERGKQK